MVIPGEKSPAIVTVSPVTETISPSAIYPLRRSRSVSFSNELNGGFLSTYSLLFSCLKFGVYPVVVNNPPR